MSLRNYGEIVYRAESRKRPYLNAQAIGEVDGYPIICVSLSTDHRLPTVLIIGGTHGDEPAGVEAALGFIDCDIGRWLDELRFEVIPCLNPYGYVHKTRQNREGIDVNWAYRKTDVPEIGIFRRLINHRRFEAVIDLHEDWESPGFYLYELRRGGEQLGVELVRRVSSVCPLNTAPSIEGAPAEAGIVKPDIESEVAKRGEGIPIALFKRHTDHLLTSETPTCLALDTRVKAHLITLDTVIEAHA